MNTRRNLRVSDEIGNVTNNRCCVIIANNKFKPSMGITDMDKVSEQSFAISRVLNTFHHIHSVTLLNSGSARVTKYLDSVKNDRAWECVIMYIMGYCGVVEGIPVIALADGWYPLDHLLSGWTVNLKGVLPIIACKMSNTSLEQWNNALQDVHCTVVVPLVRNITKFAKPDMQIELEYLNAEGNEAISTEKQNCTAHYLSGPRVRLLVSLVVKSKREEFTKQVISCLQGEFLDDQFAYNWRNRLLYQGMGYDLCLQGERYVYFDVMQLVYYLQSSNMMNSSVMQFKGHQKGGNMFFRLSESQIAQHLNVAQLSKKSFPFLYAYVICASCLLVLAAVYINYAFI